MHKEIKAHIEFIRQLCIKYDVKELCLFGSATQDPESEFRDVDLTVIFLDHLGPVERGTAFLRLKEELENLLGKEVDLVSYLTIKNPVFRQSVDRSKVTLYAA